MHAKNGTLRLEYTSLTWAAWGLILCAALFSLGAFIGAWIQIGGADEKLATIQANVVVEMTHVLTDEAPGILTDVMLDVGPDLIANAIAATLSGDGEEPEVVEVEANDPYKVSKRVDASMSREIRRQLIVEIGTRAAQTLRKTIMESSKERSAPLIKRKTASLCNLYCRLKAREFKSRDECTESCEKCLAYVHCRMEHQGVSAPTCNQIITDAANRSRCWNEYNKNKDKAPKH